MKPQSAKQKGRSFQQAIRDRLLATFPTLTVDDIRSISMGSNGSDLLLSSAAKVILPYAFECKARKSAKGLYDWMAQARSGGPTLTPIVVLKADRQKPLVMLEFDHFIDLIKPKEPIN